MDPANVSGPIDPEIIVGGKQVASDEAADQRRQAPEEELHRRIVAPIDLQRRPLEDVGPARLAGKGEGGSAEILGHALEERPRHERIDHPFKMRVAVVRLASDHFHADGLSRPAPGRNLGGPRIRRVVAPSSSFAGDPAPEAH